VNKVLLVDDQPPHESHFRRLFGQVDVCRSYAEAAQEISQGADWSAAFVDFDLAGTAEEPGPTGLSVLLLLLQKQPHVRRIAYTTLNENGRGLYAVAAWHWLETKIILDKASDEAALLTAARPGAPNPTMPARQEKMRYAGYIDDLFAQYNWLSLWQIWRFHNGSVKAVRDHLPHGNTPNSVREFSEKAARAVENFRTAFEGQNPISYERKKSAQATPLVAFAEANSKFFHAPDLQEILHFAKPWDRVQARASASRK
jgi:hypothetical protein